jgi:thioredoxin-related protein
MTILTMVTITAFLLKPESLAAEVFPTQKQLELGLNPLPYQTALDQAQAENKFVLMYYWADWCGNCKIFSENVLSDPKIIEYLNNGFKFVSINIDKDQPLAKKYRVMVVPTIVFLESSSKPASVLPGAIPGEIFSLVLSYMTSLAYKDLEFVDYLDKISQEKGANFAADSQPFFSAKAGESSPPLKAALFMRKTVRRVLDPANLQIALGMGHLTCMGLTTSGFWMGLTLASRQLAVYTNSDLPLEKELKLTDKILNKHIN